MQTKQRSRAASFDRIEEAANLLAASYHRSHADMDVGAAMELSLGRETVTVTISGLLDPANMANGHGTLALDSTALFAPEALFRELYPEIESFDYSWSIPNIRSISYQQRAFSHQ